MKTTLMSAAVTAAMIMLSQTAQADSVKGGAKADFAADELIVPCVAIEGYSEAADGTYFDIIFDRRGKSLNYEIKFAEPEDAAMCEELANYAVFIDDDADDDDAEDSIFASCAVTHEMEVQTEAGIKLKAKDLEAGDYYAVVTSGENTLTSETKTVEGDEVEFEFSSDDSDVGEGAEAIEAGFIVDKSVTAELFAADDTLVLSETVSCIVKVEDADDDDDEEDDGEDDSEDDSEDDAEDDSEDEGSDDTTA